MFKQYLQQTFYFRQQQNKFKNNLLKESKNRRKVEYIKEESKFYENIQFKIEYEHRAKRMAWFDTLEIGKQSMEFLINNEIIIEEKLKSEITEEEDPLIIPDKMDILEIKTEEHP